jgi:hypothetical protein
MPAQNGIDFNKSGAFSEDINAALSANNAANWSQIGFAKLEVSQSRLAVQGTSTQRLHPVI